METTYLIIYDITNDKTRTKIAETLENYGLERIQYSAFIGKLKQYQLRALIEDIKTILQQTNTQPNETNDIQIYPLYQTNIKNKIHITKTQKGVTTNAKQKEKRNYARIY